MCYFSLDKKSISREMTFFFLPKKTPSIREMTFQFIESAHWKTSMKSYQDNVVQCTSCQLQDEDMVPTKWQRQLIHYNMSLQDVMASGKLD